jgi:hypothetical protein
VNVILCVKPARLAKYFAVIATVAMAFVLATTATATPSASLTSTSVSPLSGGGYVVTLDGSGFAANDVVTVQYIDAEGNILVASIPTGSNGGFRSFATFVRGNLPVTYTASDTHGATASLTVTVGGGYGAPTKTDCNNGGYLPFGFSNTGQCIASVTSRPAGN